MADQPKTIGATQNWSAQSRKAIASNTRGEDGLNRYIAASAFAVWAGICDRVARRVLARAAQGQSWKGHHLTVRPVHTRGGASGRAYEVLVSSLPPEIAAQLAPPAPPRAVPYDPKRWKQHLVESVVAAGPPGSNERAAQLRQVLGSASYPSGARAGKPVPERTLRAWIATHDARGILPLILRKRRSDRGAARVIAWRAWDEAMDAAGVSPEVQRDIASKLDAKIRGLWAGGAASAANIQFCLAHVCRDMAEAAGVRLPHGEMTRLCLVPLDFIGKPARRRARMVHVKRNDAARWAAQHVPRVRRHRDGMRPMDLVAVDVRHSDILYRRPDGSLATPKVIAFLDLATNRLFARFFLLPKGEMIRRQHVLMAMRDLASDPSWGIWRGLYLDNGGEFELGAAPEDLAQLAHMVRVMHGEDASTLPGNIKSLPYNPQSKVIESIFSAFTRSIEAPYQGYIGGNRMAKKTQNQGRAPVPMEGDEAEIQARFAEMVAFYNAKPQQRGHIKGRSPNEAFAAFVDDAAQPWRALVLDRHEFALAFGKDEPRAVRPGGELHINNRVFAHPDLAAMEAGARVMVRIPILDETRVVVLSDKGEPMLVVSEAPTFGMRDISGTRAHDANRRAAGRAVARAGDGAERMDPVAMGRAALARMPKALAPPPAATVLVHPVLREAGDPEAARPLPAPSQAEQYVSPKAQHEAIKAALAGMRRAG